MSEVIKKRSSPPKYALQVKHVSKRFKLPTEKSNGIKQALINTVKGVKGYKQQEVLKDISFNIEKGDFFGIVGRNGSGKSTLLKLISQIYEPDAGEIIVNGKLVPFIELGVGFNPELTGRENVYLNGALLGFSREDMSAMYDDIVEFAELEEFMDQKLKNYSSGMQVRLAFSIAIKADADILVLDEVLAVGDEAFQRKCFNYFAELKKNKRTVILVTHSMDSVQQFCNKAMLVDKKHELLIGKPSKIAQVYRELNNDSSYINTDESENKNIKADVVSTVTKDKVSFTVKIDPLEYIEDAVITFVIYRDTGDWVYRWVSDEKIKKKIDLRQPVKIGIDLDNILPNGVFYVQVGIKSRDRTKEYAMFNDLAKFEIVRGGSYPGDIFWDINGGFTYEEST